MGVNVYYFTYIVGNVGLMGVLAAAQIIVLPLALIFSKIDREVFDDQSDDRWF